MTPPALTGFDWNGLLTLGTGLVGLVGSYFTLQQIVRSRPENITAPLDLQIKPITIERHALPQDLWEHRRKRTIQRLLTLHILSMITIILFLVSLLSRYVHFDFNFIAILVFALFGIIPVHLLFSYFLIYYFRAPDELRFKKAEDGKWYVFHQADILVEGDLNYIYSKAQEAIRGKTVQNVDLDVNAGKIEAYQRNSFRKAAGKITITIKTANETAHCYSIEVDFLNGSSTSTRRHIHARSKFINEFIGKLLTQQRPAGDTDNQPQ